MLIGIDASRANKLNKTGTEWYAFHLINELKKIDLSNQYILYTREVLNSDWENLPANFSVKILHWKFKYIWTHLRLSWEMIVNPLDILFVPAHSVPLIHRRRTIVTIHDLGFLHNSEIYHPLARLYHRLSAWWSVKKATKIITISEFTKQDILQRYNCPVDKIQVIPLGIDYNFFHNKVDTTEILKHFKIFNKYFLYIGRIEKKKNIKLLITAWQLFVKKYPEYKLILAGRDGYGSEELNKEIASLPSICKLGYITEKEKVALLQSAEAFLFPSLFEGFGLPLLEAMAAGCPVISSNATSLPEVGGEACLYFNPTKADELNVLMSNLVNKNESKDYLITAGFTRAQNFSWSRLANNTLQFLIK
ncbi:MAG: glycosyltransferase family 1 protein [Candidatus Margulisiibacteriota bacterium]|jgi:glycosyltransferase involved in cell wall biosynthesis